MGERHALFLLRDDAPIIIKKADKGSVVVVWHKKDYLRKANTNLVTKMYREN